MLSVLTGKLFQTDVLELFYLSFYILVLSLYFTRRALTIYHSHGTKRAPEHLAVFFRWAPSPLVPCWVHTSKCWRYCGLSVSIICRVMFGLFRYCLIEMNTEEYILLGPLWRFSEKWVSQRRFMHVAFCELAEWVNNAVMWHGMIQYATRYKLLGIPSIMIFIHPQHPPRAEHFGSIWKYKKHAPTPAPLFAPLFVSLCSDELREWQRGTKGTI